MKSRAVDRVCIVATEIREKRRGYPIRSRARLGDKLPVLPFVRSRRVQYISGQVFPFARIVNSLSMEIPLETHGPQHQM